MKLTKIASLLLAGALAAGALAGCSQPSDNSAAEQIGGASQEQVVQGGTAQQEEQQSAEQEAQQLLSDLSGSYQELFPVIFDERYDQLWVDDSAVIVGEADAAESAEALKDSVNGTIWGKEAIDTYGEEGTVLLRVA